LDSPRGTEVSGNQGEDAVNVSGTAAVTSGEDGVGTAPQAIYEA